MNLLSGFRRLLLKCSDYINRLGKCRMRRLMDKFVKKNRVIILVIILLVSSTFYHHHSEVNQKQESASTADTNENLQGEISESVHQDPNGAIKTILLWNELPAGRIRSVVGSGSKYFSSPNRCKFNRCKLFVKTYVMVKRPLDYYDAVIFNLNSMIYSLPDLIRQVEKIQKRRRIGQRFVSFHSEAPDQTQEPRTIKNAEMATTFFNWSMSYRQDADIHLYYGSFKPSMNKTRKSSRNFNSKKGKHSPSVAWMASHCPTNSRREDYVKELKKYIDVDVYGDCGELKCKKSLFWQFSECYQMIESKYKFYLSFENSICTDYVTEKFFRIAQLDSVVPVVHGGADYSRIAPPNSYIDARQFEPKQLADYLNKLDDNDGLFEKYLQWKDNYVVEAGFRKTIQITFCELCRKLHESE